MSYGAIALTGHPIVPLPIIGWGCDHAVVAIWCQASKHHSRIAAPDLPPDAPPGLAPPAVLSGAKIPFAILASASLFLCNRHGNDREMSSTSVRGGAHRHSSDRGSKPFRPGTTPSGALIWCCRNATPLHRRLVRYATEQHSTREQDKRQHVRCPPALGSVSEGHPAEPRPGEMSVRCPSAHGHVSAHAHRRRPDAYEQPMLLPQL
jgi:hypothetical protein